MKNVCIIVVAIFLAAGSVIGYLEYGKAGEVNRQRLAAHLAAIDWIGENLNRPASYGLASESLHSQDQELQAWSGDAASSLLVQRLRRGIANSCTELSTNPAYLSEQLPRLRGDVNEVVKLLKIVPVRHKPSKPEMDAVLAALAASQKEESRKFWFDYYKGGGAVSADSPFAAEWNASLK